MDLPTFQQLAKELSEITGEPISPEQLKQFGRPLGTPDNPTIINSKLSGYSGINGPIHYDTTFHLNMSNENYNKDEPDEKYKINKHTAQTINTDNKSNPNEIVRESLYALIQLYKDPNKHSARIYNEVFSFNPVI